MGGEHEEASPSHAIRSSSMPNAAVCNLSTWSSIPTIFRSGMGEGSLGTHPHSVEIISGVWFNACHDDEGLREGARGQPLAGLLARSLARLARVVRSIAPLSVHAVRDRAGGALGE